MFNLTSLAAEVAREKPNGEKNALRKTYKGHIKRLGVAGHFDVQKKKEDAPSEFMAMLQVPDLEWNVHQVKGREITDGLSDISLASLGRAVTMAKGPIPKGVWDSSVLGDIAPSNGDSKQPSSARPTAPNTPLAGAPGAVNRLKSQGPPGSDPLRPRRNIKKRTYGDSSYEGYGEGFPDDDAGVEAGYSTGEGEGGQKRRKKVNTRPLLTIKIFSSNLTRIRTQEMRHPTRALCANKAMALAWLAPEVLPPRLFDQVLPFLDSSSHPSPANPLQPTNRPHKRVS